jgi:hypothetical protein
MMDRCISVPTVTRVPLDLGPMVADNLSWIRPRVSRDRAEMGVCGGARRPEKKRWSHRCRLAIPLFTPFSATEAAVGTFGVSLATCDD